MVFVSLTISYIIALPMATLMLESRPNGLFKNRIINIIINRIVDILRAIPFVILVVLIFPFTRALVGTAIGTKAIIVPLTLSAIPFEMRLIEEALSQVTNDIVEAAQIDGANKIQIIYFMKWKSKLHLLVNGMSITAINLVGLSAMAGIVGGGGLGNYAIVMGFQRFNWILIFYTTLVIIGLVVLIQLINNILVRILERRLN